MRSGWLPVVAFLLVGVVLSTGVAVAAPAQAVGSTPVTDAATADPNPEFGSALVSTAGSGMAAAKPLFRLQTTDARRRLPAGAPNGTNTSVNVGAGTRLATVISVTSSDVQTEFGETAFSFSLRHNASRRAQLVADRAAKLRSIAVDIRNDLREVRRSYRADEITRGEFARRIATLSWRARNLANSTRQLRSRAGRIPSGDLAVAGYNGTALANAVERLEPLRSQATAALVDHYTVESEGHVSVSADGGTTITVTDGIGGQARQVERDPDGDRSLTVDRSTALEAARADLSTRAGGDWVLVRHFANLDSGVYVFAFRLDSNVTYGTAVVQVDGSSGNVVGIEEEVRPRTGRYPQCAERVTALRAEMRAKIASTDSAGERTEIRRTYERRVEDALAACRSDADDADDEDDSDQSPASECRERISELRSELERRLRAADSAAEREAIMEEFARRVRAIRGECRGAPGSRIDRSAALETARDALSAPADGRWRLEGSILVPDGSDNGSYVFAFRLSSGERFGIARVRVDAGNGSVLGVESETSGGVNDTDEGNVTPSRALSIAREALPTPTNGTWAHHETDREDGVFRVVFGLDAPAAAGDAMVRIGADSGRVLAVRTDVSTGRVTGDRIGERRAVEIARTALSDPESGTWTPTEIRLSEGVYYLQFELDSPSAGGWGGVIVDAATGEVLETQSNVTSGNNTSEQIGKQRAVRIARGALEPVENGTWTTTDVSLRNGLYYVEFELDHPSRTGHGGAVVESSTGHVLESRSDVTGGNGSTSEEIGERRAVDIAHDAVPAPDNGTWVDPAVTLVGDVYEVTFTLEAPSATGKATVSVDAHSGDVLGVTEDVSTDGGSDDRISESRAVEIAHGALPSEDGTWVHANTTLRDGVYHVQFELDSSSASGWGGAMVDATTGAVVDVQTDVTSDTSSQISESKAVEIARNALTDPDKWNGSWKLDSVDLRDGTYYVEFQLDSPSASGWGGAKVDAETGDVIETREDVNGG